MLQKLEHIEKDCRDYGYTYLMSIFLYAHKKLNQTVHDSISS